MTGVIYNTVRVGNEVGHLSKAAGFSVRVQVCVKPMFNI